MNEYEFSLHFKLNTEEDPSWYVQQLEDAGCDDALIGIGRKGLISLDFIRDADHAEGAVYGAIENVLQAIPHAELIEVTPDKMNLSGLSNYITENLFKISKQAVQKFASGKTGKKLTEFPTGYAVSENTYWHLQDVLEWLIANKKIPAIKVKEAELLLSLSKVIKECNITSMYYRLTEQVTFNTALSGDWQTVGGFINDSEYNNRHLEQPIMESKKYA